MLSYYEVLKVSRTATKAEIKAAYRRQRSEHHPDRNHNPESTHRMQLINEAWEVLSDTQKRAKHDEALYKTEKLEEFLREMEEEVVDDPVDEDEEPFDKSVDAPNVGLETEQADYCNRVGLSWVAASMRATPKKKREPTYAVYRTDFTGGNKTYYYYALDSYEVASKCGRAYGAPKPLLKGSRSVRCRIINQELMDRIMEGNGVLWVEGTPKGDLTLKYLG